MPSHHTLSAVSTFRRQKNTLTSTGTPTPSHTDRAKEATCPECKGTFKIFTEGARGWNNKPQKVCITCYRARRRIQRQQCSPQTLSPNVQAIKSEPISQIAGLETNSNQPMTLDHHIFSKGEWKCARLLEHPRVLITISIDQSAQRKNSRLTQIPAVHTEVLAIADTGAQSNLWLLEEFLGHGFSRDDLRPVRLNLTAAKHSPSTIEGAFFAILTAKSPSGRLASCHSMVHVSSSLKTMFLSYESLLDLGLISNDFWSPDNVRNKVWHPNYTRVPGIKWDKPSINAIQSINDGCIAQRNSHDAQCSWVTLYTKYSPSLRGKSLTSGHIMSYISSSWRSNTSDLP